MFTALANGALPSGRLMFQPGPFRASFTLHPTTWPAGSHRPEHSWGRAVLFAYDGLLTNSIRGALSPSPTNHHVNALPPCRKWRGFHAGGIR